MPTTSGTRFRADTPPSKTPRPAGRIDAVDILRGIALIGMLAVHSLVIFNDDGTPTFVTQTAAGRSAAIFAVLAGVSLALMTGRHKPVTGRRLDARLAGIAARAIYIAVVGTAVGYLTVATNVHLSVILVYYGIAFLAAVPLLKVPTRLLVPLAAVGAVAVPVIIYAARPYLKHTDSEQETLLDLFVHPVRFISEMFVMGTYPILALLVLMVAGIAIGRLDLRSKQVAVRLVVVGTCLAVAAWVASTVLLLGFGGQDALFANTTTELNNEVTPTTILWWPQSTSATPWELAQRVGHSNTTFDLVHSIGIASALLGALLLVTRFEPVRRLLAPVGAAGSMPLTVYTLQILLLAIWTFDLQPYSLYFYVMVAALLTFATVWRKVLVRGPLESGAVFVARAAANRVLAKEDDQPRSDRTKRSPRPESPVE